MKKAYQIDERRAIEKFRSHLLNDRGTIQMILPLAEIAQGLRGGVAPFLLQAQRQLLLLIMEDDVNSITGPRYQRTGPRAAGLLGNTTFGPRLPILVAAVFAAITTAAIILFLQGTPGTSLKPAIGRYRRSRFFFRTLRRQNKTPAA